MQASSWVIVERSQKGATVDWKDGAERLLLQSSLVGKAQDRRSARAPRVTARALRHPPTQRYFSWGLQAVSSCSSSGAIETRARERRRAFIISNAGHKRVTRYPELHATILAILGT